MIRAVVVEDEPLARQYLCTLLEETGKVEVVGEADDGRAGLRLCAERAPDAAFLDIRIPGPDGLSLAGRLLTLARPPLVVFVTGFSGHAVDAFRVEAVDYLLKPFDDQRFAQALARAKEHVRQGRAKSLAQQLAAALAPPARTPAPPRTLLLKDGARSMFLREDEIDWIEAQDYYVEIHAGSTAHLHREPLRDLEARLDPKRFIRIHRSVIVQIDRIRQLQSLPSGDAAVILRDGTELRVSRSRRDAIRAALGV